jgi:hypothetical protein
MPLTDEQECLIIQELEARMWNKVLTAFHFQATEPDGSECIFWNDMCRIRKQYLAELENLKE